LGFLFIFRQICFQGSDKQGMILNISIRIICLELKYKDYTRWFTEVTPTNMQSKYTPLARVLTSLHHLLNPALALTERFLTYRDWMYLELSSGAMGAGKPILLSLELAKK